MKLIAFICVAIFVAGCSTIEPMVKNEYTTIRDMNIQNTRLIEKIAILVDLKEWQGKSPISKSENERMQDIDIAEVAFKGAVEKILKLKGYECIYVDSNLKKAYEEAYNKGCQALLYASFRWAKGRVYYDQEYLGNYSKIWYAEDVPMADGYFDIVDISTKDTIFEIRYKGHSNMSGNRFYRDNLKGEKEIPYIYRLVEESLKKFPTIDKLIKQEGNYVK